MAFKEGEMESVGVIESEKRTKTKEGCTRGLKKTNRERKGTSLFFFVQAIFLF
jgi:hypothetical protein